MGLDLYKNFSLEKAGSGFIFFRFDPDLNKGLILKLIDKIEKNMWLSYHSIRIEQ